METQTKRDLIVLSVILTLLSFIMFSLWSEAWGICTSSFLFKCQTEAGELVPIEDCHIEVTDIKYSTYVLSVRPNVPRHFIQTENPERTKDPFDDATWNRFLDGGHGNFLLVSDTYDFIRWEVAPNSIDDDCGCLLDSTDNPLEGQRFRCFERGITAIVEKKLIDFDGDGFLSDMDCNDYDPGINPFAGEVCEDGIDQDCDGIDVQCPCDPCDSCCPECPKPVKCDSCCPVCEPEIVERIVYKYATVYVPTDCPDVTVDADDEGYCFINAIQR